jgi:hypothetical protein
MDNIKICEICGFQTDNGKVMSNHKRWKHISPKGSENYNKTLEKLSQKGKERYGVQDKLAICPECGKEFMSHYMKKGRWKKYCSVTCANKQGSKYVDYKKFSDYQKEHGTWKKNFIKNGLGNRKNHSKRELEIVSYFKKNFPNDEWKQGLIDGGRKHDGCLINPDLWSKKLKIIIEYDGDWHFKDINNQLEHKQKVDKATMKFCEENGYRIIRIDEKEKVSNEQIVESVYQKQDSKILFGDRYNYLY